MEFDCWTGLRIEGKPYIIVEKSATVIRYGSAIPPESIGLNTALNLI